MPDETLSPLADLAIEAWHGFKTDRLPIFREISVHADASEEVRAVALSGLGALGDTTEGRNEVCARLLQLLDPKYAQVVSHA